MRFEIDFLDDYTDESLLNELRRVATLYSGQSLTTDVFEKLSKRVSATTIRRRFGTWRIALSRAGLEHLYSGRIVSLKMREQPAKRLSVEDLIAELQRVRSLVGTDTLSRTQFNAHSVTSYEAVRNRIGWYEALRLAGIPAPTNVNRNWTTQQCFDNLAVVWTHHARPPAYREMFKPPSSINGKAYGTRWGTWRRALRAFVEWTESEQVTNEPQNSDDSATTTKAKEKSTAVRRSEQDNREVSTRLRFRVFQRDRFRCVACGCSPATDLTVILHADHIDPVARGGKTLLENLQTLCERCNLGKGILRM